MQHFLARHSVTPVRALLGVALILVHLGVVGAGLAGSWREIFLALKVPLIGDLPFGDLRVITGGVVSADQGLDPLYSNPGDPWQRPLNYPRIWLLVGRAIPGEGGIVAAGVLFAAVFSAAVAWLVATQRSTLAASAIWLVAVSSAVWLALERANTDLVVFAIVALALFVPWRHRSVLLGIAAVLKLFPVAALAAKLVRDRSFFTVMVLLVVFIYFAGTASDIAQISGTTRMSPIESFGVRSAVLLFEMADSPVPAAYVHAAFGLGTVLAAGLGWMLPVRGASASREEDMAFLGGAILLLCYIAGGNWDYRLIFALFLIPYLLRPAQRMERMIGAVTIAAILVSVNFAPLVAVFGDFGVVANSAAKYLLYCIVVFTLVRIAGADPAVQAVLARVRARRPSAKGERE